MKNVLITGSSSGLGKELALLFSQKGWQVTGVDLVASDHCKTIVHDFSSDKKVTLKEAYDVIICNAGISLSGKFIEEKYEQHERLFRVNVLGPMNLVRQLLAEKKINSKGSIVFVCSAAEFLPWAVAPVYAATKSALSGFGFALQPYVKSKKITVSRVYPGPMRTAHAQYYEGIDEGRGADPKNVAKAVYRGIVKKKRIILPDTVGRLVYVIHAVFPGILCHMIFKKYKRFMY